ncbi:MAG: ABC transporter permease [Acidiphilium sp. 37-64-53]|uniref:ABC transporter permease n=1 Tax=Acidiphilium TaxID=522 RepID=UPI000BD06BE8|nr:MULTISPECIES: ABC transporter permease [Acidiphilium]OYW04163.1 MAG: ABC transporter permease [Acidiphilium sp. 37-64-53]OZB31097.1 MAG: ABC transporter permease [Acidiphilium sp. 34-64-41]HQT83409.1 ABC transporter permease [Acidiphilium rubrum]
MSQNLAPPIRRALLLTSLPVYGLLYAPLALIAVFSFAPAPGSTTAGLHWYNDLLHAPDVLAALRRSLTLALGSSILGTALGTLMGFGLSRFRSRARSGFAAALPSLIIYTPIIMPSLVFGISELIFFNLMHKATGLFAAGLLTMGIAHVTFQAPYVALVVFARMAGLDPNLFEASQDLYANGRQSFLYLTVPVIRPAIIGGFLLAFTLSIDDFTISYFTAGPGSTTLPIYIYSAVARKGISPDINALATLMIATVIGIGLLQYGFTRQKDRQTVPRTGD